MNNIFQEAKDLEVLNRECIKYNRKGYYMRFENEWVVYLDDVKIGSFPQVRGNNTSDPNREVKEIYLQICKEHHREVSINSII